MSDAIIIKGEIDDGVDPTFSALIVGPDGIALIPADVAASGVTCKVFDATNGTPDSALVTLTLNPSTTYNGFPLMSGTLQTTGWQKSSDGYNFRHLLQSSAVPGGLVGGHVFRVEYTFQLVNTTTAALGTGIARQLFELIVRPAYS